MTCEELREEVVNTDDAESMMRKRRRWEEKAQIERNEKINLKPENKRIHYKVIDLNLKQKMRAQRLNFKY